MAPSASSTSREMLSDPRPRFECRNTVLVTTLVLIVAFALRLFVASRMHGFHYYADAQDYDRYARSIAQGHGFPPSALARMLELPSRTNDLLDFSWITTDQLAHGERYGWWLAAVLAIAGAFTKRMRCIPSWIWLSGVLLFVGGAVTTAVLRYRVPLDPIVLLGTAATVTTVARWIFPAKHVAAAPGSHLSATQ
jgi:hypothetical protein